MQRGQWGSGGWIQNIVNIVNKLVKWHKQMFYQRCMTFVLAGCTIPVTENALSSFMEVNIVIRNLNH